MIHAVFQNNTSFRFMIRFIYTTRKMKNLRKKLLQKELSTDEKFPCNKVAKDCGHLTKEIGLLQSQALQATR